MTDFYWYVFWAAWTIGGFGLFRYVDRRSPPYGFPSHWGDIHLIVLLIASGPILWVRILFSDDTE